MYVGTQDKQIINSRHRFILLERSSVSLDSVSKGEDEKWRIIWKSFAAIFSLWFSS